MSAANSAVGPDLDEQAVVDVISPSNVDPSVWQDVYQPIIAGRQLYIKFTLDTPGDLLLISFKEDEL